MFVDDEEVRNSPTQQFGNTRTMGGDIKFKDVNGDGQISTLDMVPIGHPTSPEIIYGLALSGSYKGFDLSAFFQGSARSSFFIDVEQTSPFVAYRYKTTELPGVRLQNQLLKVYADNHWSEEDRNLYALWPRLSPELNSNSTQPNTWFMRNGAFFRIKQVDLGYTLPARLTKQIRVQKLRLYGSVVNAFTFSKFKLWDVEMGGEGLGYPVQRVVNIGLEVGF